MGRTGNQARGRPLAWLLAFSAITLGLFSARSQAAPAAQFTAEADRAEITLEDSVSLKFNIRSEGNGTIGEPRFNAPDFDLINQYSSVFVESFYENGRFGMRNNRQLTKVLRPSKQGELRITGLEVTIDGRVYKASDIVVRVGPPGSGTPPPKNYGGAGVGLRGAGKRGSLKNVMVRAELDKEKLYKGEQLIVSYYLYSRVRFFNLAVEKYPALNGFLKEELEMPIAGNGRLTGERVILDGIPYQRSLLLRYAAYPLQSGQLTIDSLPLKYSYYPAQGDDGFTGEDDPFMQFFQQLAPRASQDRSDPLKIHVTPLPEENRPASFTGGVGDFQITSAVDKYELRANEAVLLTVKVEGRGNVAAIGEPKASWPQDIELYESKGQAKSGPGGVGQKVFEFLLIPRAPGKVTLPPLDFSYFNPTSNTFITTKTDPVELTVHEAAPGTASGGVRTIKPAPSATTVKSPVILEPKGLKALAASVTAPSTPIWRWFYWLALACFGALTALVATDLAKKGHASARAILESKAKAHSKSWDRMASIAHQAKSGAAWREVLEAYDLLTSAILDALEKRHPVGVRSFSRSELGKLLAERGMNEQTWKRFEALLEYADMVRFASSVGAVSENSARDELEKWVREGKDLTQSVER
ncbi:MAG: hypothetical protein A2X94_05355 [Bdellovibrionales bacterium GWB1_55_8]|nr:MAG: hypothetical protein A2X94_05355 [Bdellovibrionales bacterium GWB1_55_8]